MTKLLNNYKLIELIELNDDNLEENNNNILQINTEKTSKDLMLLCLNDAFEK
jgi:hypothetical protein